MAISSLSAVSTDTTNPLLAKLEANGLSADKAQVVENDLSGVLSDATGSGSGPVDSASVRAALDQKIDEDVASGKLSQSDATAVKKTLDDLDAQASGSGAVTAQTSSSSDSSGSAAAGGSSASGGAGGAGGGGGGSSTKTEVSETVTVSGGIETTVITYSDGTTSTTTTAASQQDEQKYDKQPAQAAAESTASKYLSTIRPGSLFQLMA